MVCRESLVDLLLRQMEAAPEKLALIHGEQRLSYKELWQRIIRLSQELTTLGVKPGARVLLYMDNSTDYVTAYYALAYLSAVSVPLNTGLKGSQLADIVAHAQSKLLLHSGPQPLLHASAKAFQNLGVHLWDLGQPRSGITLTASPRDNRHQYEPEKLSSIVYTSGTTGKPKGVMLSGGNLCSNTTAIIDYLKLTAADRGLCVLPFYYVYGNSVLHTHLAVGATLVLEDNLLYPQKMLATMARERVTGFAGVPSSYRLLLNRCDLKNHPLPHLRYLTQAGGALAPEDVRRIIAAWPQIQFYVMYGQTEATARLTYLPPEYLDDKLGSVGVPVSGVSIKIFDSEGCEKARGEMGEICASGPSIMMGYWRDPEASQQKMFGDWLRTGDLGYQDEDGFITIVGRNSDMIKTGDHRVSPEEIEQIIAGYQGVDEVAVIGVPDALLGQAIKACIVPSPDAALERREILHYCRQRLPAYKLPKVIQIIDALPKTASGKVQRYLLQTDTQQEHCV